MANDKLIPANKDRTILIKEKDAGFMHVKCTRITILPGDPLHPVRNTWVQIFDLPTWLRMQQLKEAKVAVDWQKASLVSEAVIVHDCRIKS